MIHPQAIIDRGARLGPGVEIGPFSIIGPEVEIGEGCWIGPHVVIKGPTRIGRSNRIYQFCSIGEDPQDLKFQGERSTLEIGDHNAFREYCTVSRGTDGGGGVTRIGHHNFFMANVHVAHDCQVGSHTIFANVASLAGHVTVDDYAILGGFTGVHQFCRIGAHCMTAGGSVVIQDIPPYTMVAGNTARPYGINITGLKRRGFTPEAVTAIKRAYKLVYKSGLRLEDAIAEIKRMHAAHPEVGRLVEFLGHEGRGIVR
ncbi:MAG: acyl-ACP--UDP-N-acetylglucosamine O-acyltransferase [Gammaproteobacteria bacterium]|nr:acyl-ACP--UDP-N-acetylglucosamine O-acyltransferase [Gammaproteobacteria bacterium]